MKITLIGTKLHSYCIKYKETRAQPMKHLQNLLFEGTIQPPFITINCIIPSFGRFDNFYTRGDNLLCRQSVNLPAVFRWGMIRWEGL